MVTRRCKRNRSVINYIIKSQKGNKSNNTHNDEQPTLSGLARIINRAWKTINYAYHERVNATMH